ncbi:MAG: hypothetical protein ACRD96_10770 [Bryobacteraceae bacterium]
MISKLIRRTHMYLALFLAPWVLIYTLSTMAMNHRDWFRRFYAGPIVHYEKERDLPWAGAFAPDATPQSMAAEILSALSLEGAHGARRGPGGATIVQRLDPITPRRITYRPADNRVVIEREVFRTPAFLERMHRRRGYQHNYALEDSWAFTVDLFIAAMVFWALSGLWMWWEMRATWRLGILFLLGGAALFTGFALTI